MAEENRLKKKGRSRRWWWTVPASADEGCSAGGRQRRLGVFFSIGDVDVVRPFIIFNFVFESSLNDQYTYT